VILKLKTKILIIVMNAILMHLSFYLKIFWQLIKISHLIYLKNPSFNTLKHSSFIFFLNLISTHLLNPLLSTLNLILEILLTELVFNYLPS